MKRAGRWRTAAAASILRPIAGSGVLRMRAGRAEREGDWRTRLLRTPSVLLAFAAVLLLLAGSVPALAHTSLPPALVDADGIDASWQADRTRCDATDGEPSLATSDDAPSLLAVAKARQLPAPPPIARLVLVAEARPDTDTLVASERTRPSDGLDVPACRAEQRWRLAHTTATSPA